jgi:hypothetical protein
VEPAIRRLEGGRLRVGQGLGIPLRGDDIGEAAPVRPVHHDVERAAGKQPGCYIEGVLASAGADLQHSLAGDEGPEAGAGIARRGADGYDRVGCATGRSAA